MYCSILASLSTLPVALRTSINRNLTDIVELHQDILTDLKRYIPQIDCPQVQVADTSTRDFPSHNSQRPRNLDAVPEHVEGEVSVQKVPNTLTDAQTAADVARVFGKRASSGPLSFPSTKLIPGRCNGCSYIRNTEQSMR